MQYVPNELLSRLIGHELYSVQFVMGDRVEFWFSGDGDDHPHLLCDVWPAVKFRGVAYSYEDAGFGDALMQMIPAQVLRTQEASGVGLKIEFRLGSITIHPRAEEVADEIATLTGFADQSMMVWRPGEDSFEDILLGPSQ